jgi:RND family efflux transporter MFP subunit
MKPIITVAILVMPLLLGGCKGKIQPGTKDVPRQVVSGVKVMKILLTEVDAYYETAGTVRARNTSIIASRIMAAVMAVNVKEGDSVKAGQLLMILDDGDAAQRVSGAEAGYKEAEKTFEAAGQESKLATITYQRYSRLYDDKVISRQEMDQIETKKRIADIEYERMSEGVTRAGALLNEAKVHHAFTRVTAPLSGIVSARKVDAGTMAAPGMPLLIVEDTSRFRVDAYIDERLSGKLKPGMSVSLRFDVTKEQMTGKIAEVVPAIDAATRTYLVKIDVDGWFLKPGLYARVLIPEGKKETLLVPQTAVVERGQLLGVYAVDEEGVIAYRLVRTGKTYDRQVEVLSGLKPGDSIISDGVDKARDGGVVKQ